MSMTTAMEWEAPIPVWIESISIDIDEEMPVSDLMATIPADMDDTPSPCTPDSAKMHSFMTEQNSIFGSLLDVESVDMMLDIKEVMVVVESPIKTKYPNTPSLSPVKSKLTAKPARRSGRKVNVDPSGRDQRRKDKQRGYETSYRKRQKDKRSNDGADWIQLETQIREMLAKRTPVVVFGSLDELKTETKPSTVSIRQRYLELLQEERALRESEALDSCVLAGHQAMALWGGATSKSRDIREKMNALPSLRSCHTFEFSW